MTFGKNEGEQSDSYPTIQREVVEQIFIPCEERGQNL